MSELDPTVREIAEGEAARPEVRALVLAGSHASGEAHAYSDVDLYAILAEGYASRFRSETISGFRVEVAEWTEAKAYEKIRTNPMCWSTFTEGIVISDDGILQALRDEIERIAARWRPDPAELAGCAHWLRSAVEKVRGNRESERMAAAFAMSSSTFELVRGIYLLNGRPVLASSAALRGLAQLPTSPDAELVTKMLIGEPLSSRFDAFVRLAEWTADHLEQIQSGRD